MKHLVALDGKKKLELDDIGRVLAALLKAPIGGAQPAEYACKLLTKDHKFLKLGKHSNSFIDIDHMPKLRFAKLSNVFVGGGGVIIKCIHNTLDSLTYALKTTRPSLYTTSEESDEEFRKAQDEYAKHAPLAHPNVARAFFLASLDMPSSPSVTFRFGTMLMEWIEQPARHLNDYLLEAELDWLGVTNILIQCFDGLSYLHQKQLVHWDLKSENIMVDANGVSKLMDFGNARFMGANSNNTQFVQSSDWNVPLQLSQYRISDIGQVKSSKRTTYKLPDASWDIPWLDLWMLARELNRLFLADEKLVKEDLKHDPKPDDKRFYNPERARRFIDRFSPDDPNAVFALGFIKLILRRLLYPQNPAASKYYSEAKQVADDLRKLIPEFGAGQRVPELQAIPQHVLRVPCTGNLPYTTRIGAMLNCSLIERLSRHLQLATLVHVYPGASHRRFEHVAGVLTTVIQYVRALYADRTEPFWRITVEETDIKALLVASLLHDVGHCAFGHYLEEMEGLFYELVHEKYVLAILDKKRRQKLSTRLLGNILEDRQQLETVLKTHWGITAHDLESFCKLVAEIIKPHEMQGEEVLASEAVLIRDSARKLTVQIMHSIIDSAIDADKMDYLLRDGDRCGVKYPHGIDLDRFYQSLTTVPYIDSEDQKVLKSDDTPESSKTAIKWDVMRASIAVTEKGVLPAVSILSARYQMFDSVYWHHTARAESAMLQYLVQRVVGSGKTEQAIKGRLEELTMQFRERDDTKALDWIDAEIDKLKTADKAFLHSMIKGISGSRKHLFWQAFELKYEGDKGTLRTRAKKIHAYLAQRFAAVHSTRSYSGVLEKSKKLRSEYAILLAKELVEHSRRHISFEDGEVLIDIPAAGRDLVENVFVRSDNTIRPIQWVSPVADAVSDTFTYWARRVRVFLAPSAWNKCERVGCGEPVVRQLAARAMAKLTDSEELQLVLIADK